MLDIPNYIYEFSISFLPWLYKYLDLAFLNILNIVICLICVERMGHFLPVKDLKASALPLIYGFPDLASNQNNDISSP